MRKFHSSKIFTSPQIRERHQNRQFRDKCYQPQSLTLADNTCLALNNSGYLNKPHPIIVYNQLGKCEGCMHLRIRSYSVIQSNGYVPFHPLVAMVF